MSALLENLGALAAQDPTLAYAIVYLATIFFGNIAAFIALWGAFHGYFGAWGIPALLLTFYVADVSGDVLWYSLGRELRGTRFGEFIKDRMPYHEKVEERITRSGIRLVYLAKFVYATAFPVIFMIGWSQVDFKKFVRASLRSTLVWLPFFFVVAIALISSLNFLQARVLLQRFEWLLGVVVVIFLLLEYRLGRFFKNRFGKNGGAENGSP